MTLLDTLQKIVSDQLSSAQLTDMTVGTVTSLDPLEITLDIHQQALRGNAIILTDAVRGGGSGSDRYFSEVDGELCITWGQTQATGDPDPGLAVGDAVLLLAVQHGQTYIVLSRL